MNRIILLLTVLAILVVVPAMGDAFVDAKYWIWDTDSNLIYMRDDEGELIYGNILVGQRIKFDASQSQSYYGKIDRYWYDIGNDGTYDIKKSTSTFYYTFDEPGIYMVKLLAVDTDGPSGSSDVVIHEIRVVEKLLEPSAYFVMQVNRSSSEAVKVTLNASSSFDPDGYIQLYRWDIDDDGDFEEELFRRPLFNTTFTQNGYYRISLSVEDWEELKDGVQRVLKVDGIGGQNVTQQTYNITVNNKQDVPVNMTIIANNWDRRTVQFVDTMEVALPLNPDGHNEIYVATSTGAESWFVVNGHNVDITLQANNELEFDDNNRGLPGFSLVAILSGLGIAALIAARRTIKS